jgi:hypothetical protein
MSADHSDETSSVSSGARSDDPRIEKNDKEIWDEHFADVLGDIEKPQAASTPRPAKLQFDDGIHFIKVRPIYSIPDKGTIADRYQHVPRWSDPNWEDQPNVSYCDLNTLRELSDLSLNNIGNDKGSGNKTKFS